MPATNEEFIKRAFEAGLTEEQVRAAVAERNAKSQSNQSGGVVNSLTKGDTLPNLFQAAAGVASIPLTLPLDVVNPTAGKTARAGIGTLGRAGGESMRGLLDSVINGRGPLPILSSQVRNNPEILAEETQKAGEDLNSLANQIVSGAAGETAGEFVVGPLLSKALSIAGKGTKKVGQVTGDVLDALPVTSQIKNFLKSNANRAINTAKNWKQVLGDTIMENAPRGLREMAEDRLGLDTSLGREFAQDVESMDITGTSIRAIRQSVQENLTSTGAKIVPELEKIDQRISLEPLREEAIKKYQELYNVDPGEAAKYKNFIDGFLSTQDKDISPVSAFDWKKANDELIYLESGDTTRKTITSGEWKARKQVSDFLRSQLHKFDSVSNLLNDYERLSMYNTALAGTQLSGIPTQATNLLNRGVMGSVRNPEFIMNELSRQPSPVVSMAADLAPNVRSSSGQLSQVAISDLMNR